MKVKFKGFIAILFFLFVSLLPAQNSKVKEIDEYIDKAVKDWQMPGVAVAIVKNDTVIFAKGYGVRDLNKGGAVDENTLFVIASCTKAFTTASLAMLAGEGKIAWNDPVTKYLKDFQMYDPWVTKEITIRDLITHRSGLETFSGDIMWLGSNYDRKEVIRRARYLKPTSSFRTKFGYQNIMFSAAGEIIPAVTDTSWDDFVKARILTPLGMKRSVTRISDLVKMDNIASAHQFRGGKTSVIGYYPVDNVAPAAAINSSVSEVAQWIRLQMGNGSYNGKRIIPASSFFELHMNQMAMGSGNYGLGWFISYYKGKRVVDHGGGMPGMISEVCLVPEEKLGFVILTNLDCSFTTVVKNKILDEYLGGKQTDWSRQLLPQKNYTDNMIKAEYAKREKNRTQNTQPSLPLEKYTGTYEDQMYGNSKVSIKEGKLYLEMLPSKTFKGELKHWHYDTFYVDWDEEFLTRGWIKFDLDFNGNVKQMSMEVPCSPDFIFTELLFKKLPDKK
jgi:CubicO group peptidase (beta-lactamase class C family)